MRWLQQDVTIRRWIWMLLVAAAILSMAANVAADVAR